MASFEMNAVSFDIFETLLLRPYLSPEDLHEAVYYRNEFPVCPDLDAGTWKLIRIQAEVDARRRNGVLEISLAQIYSNIQQRLGLTDSDRDAAMAAELTHELEAVVPIAEHVSLLADIRKNATVRVCFCSDMYLPKSAISAMLERHGLLESHDLLLVSSHLGKSKAEGGLFRHLLEELKLEAGEVLHIGDNYHSDVKNASSFGLRTRHVNFMALNRHEHRLAKEERVSTFLRSSIIGSSRAARNSLHGLSKNKDVATILDISASVTAPFLVGFVLWTMREARKAGVEHLFFLARDGQVLQQIADVFRLHGVQGLKSSYMYASRQSLFLPALNFDDEESLDILARMMTDRSLSNIARSLDVKYSDLFKVAGGALSGDFDVERNISESEAVSLALAIRSSPLSVEIQANAAVQRNALIAYITQLLPQRVNFAIVDVGWRGNLQTFMARALRYSGSATPAQLTGYYVGLAQHPPAHAGDAYAYLHAVAPGQPELIELMCAADHGTTLRYAFDSSEKAVAQVDDAGNPHALDWGVLDQQAAVVRFAELLCRALPESLLFSDELLAALHLHGVAGLEALRLEPTYQEAVAFGSFRHAEDPRHQVFREIAPRYSAMRTALHYIFPKANISWVTYWPAASLMRSLGYGPWNILKRAVTIWRRRMYGY